MRGFIFSAMLGIQFSLVEIVVLWPTFVPGLGRGIVGRFFKETVNYNNGWKIYK